jgi:O-methyltransferase
MSEARASARGRTPAANPGAVAATMPRFMSTAERTRGQGPPVSLRSLAGRLVRPLRLDVPLGRVHDMAPRIAELRHLGRYRRAAGLWRQLHLGGYTMIGSRRARALHRLAEECEQQAVPGAFVDCGCFNGGSSVMLATGAPGREVWAFDSFQGLPQAGPRDPERARGWTGELVASEDKVREAFERFAEPTQLHVVRGWFHDTLQATAPLVGRVALLHADGDWYESVKLTLETFEPRVSPGGFVVIDDYGAWEGARDATHEYRDARRIDAPLVEIDQTAAYWRKSTGA